MLTYRMGAIRAEDEDKLRVAPLLFHKLDELPARAAIVRLLKKQTGVLQESEE